ncbi:MULTISPECIES: signal recognition particle-docking protein FtsY [Methylobacterium]|uniref:Signal recognition particle receptor FtsY n=5 Tax=Pseudomonadota TaxID=1224 RepID=A0ABQ4STK3_9HYPH|nr:MULTISPECIES: signal recognition particle-docking protein FtsY [Methylobacterium]PIU05583.1 MAG: signal recognition particle-docking protein FtsY [Methylobacterium sp. CG09_land_8_20_14_0_10_71_15]PIU14758.1 MAG: signal recognition particle-docking protein FtsY [Methylobacterium sp. CG08_land_8_20_14_0_20_71_15]GBU18409.1 signal recognition particle receptor [Methylobacterium sp.]GJE05824.1 Signal recognition particle receptor FtsY [Methylobacterium jeotgali]
MSRDEKPGWLGRLFGRKGAEAEAPSAETLPVDSPASESEGRPDFATGADDVTTAPLPPSEPGPGEAGNAVPDAVEGADMLPVEGEPEQPPPGTAGDDPERGAEPATPSPLEREPLTDADAAAATPEGRSWWSRFSGAEPHAPEPAAEIEPAAGPAEPDIQPIDSAAALASDAAEDTVQTEPRGWWSRLTQGMRRTSTQLSDRVTGLFTKRKLDATTLEELEDALIQADFGIETAMRVSEAVGKGRYEKGISADEVRAILAAEVERALDPVAVPLTIDSSAKPFVILTVGVNGAGKTTTIGKLALKLKAEGRSVMLAAGDTFRAAAVEQLKVWGDRTGTPVVTRPAGSDAAGLAFDALTEARAAGTDILLIDTAGRLQNKAGLMAELEKIVRVIRKVDAGAPHATLLVLDATVGQNALSQVELFSQAAPVSGLVMTKLDGTARGGILVALAAKHALPVHFIGVGEGVEDLEPFAARDFARAIAGLGERDAG